MKPKLNDVAKLAGVSATTVSRVINNHGYLSQKTKDKVFEAMRELHYQPNNMARSLQGKKTRLIGVIFSDISHPFFGELVSRIEKLLFAQNYKVILCNSADDPQKEREYLQMLMANQVDGIIAGAHNLGIEEYQQYGLPIISFDRYLSDNVPIVSSDNQQGGRLATQALHQAGAQKIAIFTGKNHAGSPTNGRREGYEAYLKTAQLTPHFHEIPFEWSPALKMMTIKKILVANDYDGVFCSDDLTALLTINVAKQLQLSVPDDLKVVGYDGTALIRNYHPDLTTIEQPLADISELLVSLLLQRIADAECDLEPMYQLPVKLVKGITA
ncbi:LacI family DNA-binding transcriptional regulator [Lactiplantibacillus mudanjiangensis]|uniref:Sucrose operon repressor [Lactobacillus plantarum JDM1] n=1 Tax=Lactiplantibacillus mudanjiangensis TaxID=1296538 RepID=A0A660DYX4_9LACO|nr:LacI family DNA-binding transcriptional regulator [Lactiplantibacillus mudanjiangensis]VDG20270.1 sucrose operon repressor [Lactobacillus plantarum JDM1] [Lactiplantibacillus mudanjiangensis]VDG24040.1 sucrose operon repressor [Lactobacillus plantarum JDM1] [Lactiplantibacillus mudanjiangensis]VDG27284.1 sucrose operon repressor [Lactobacillus plantarum JDM1] [Lactiplantibacillus mudanjiangensis]VDG33864.1 sucrose operon repressor [Lactobacillus plantarum JDM1] [Lactiplantibacillus mudanjian